MSSDLLKENGFAAINQQYEIIKQIGKGGFSTIHQATQKATGQSVAIKILHINPDETEATKHTKIERFKREVELCTALQHPNIVKILDSGQTDAGTVYLVFEYVPGESLAELIKREGALSLPRTVKLMLQLLDAIRAAHAQGIIHRDLKPENIMLLQTETVEQVKILDFGIGTFVPGRYAPHNRLTLTSDFLGTPMYSAPEQLRGEPVSSKSDLYSWGLLFLECLTGKPPFPGKIVAEVVRHQLSSRPVPVPVAIRDHQLGTFFKWVLNKEADRRAGDASLVLFRLQAIALDDIPNQNGFLADTDINGKNHPFEVPAAGENGTEGDTGSIGHRNRYPFVGRVNQLYTLTKHFETKALPVLVQGEAGIGKSRLIAEFAKQVQISGGRPIVFRCVPEGRKSALYPIFEVLRKQFGQRPQQNTEENISLLDASLSHLTLDLPTLMPVLCLGFGYASVTYPPPAISPQKQKERLFNSLIAVLLKMTEATSAVIIFEDLHWADSTTLEFLALLLGKSAGHLFLVMTSREPLADHPLDNPIETIQLGRLLDSEIEQIIADASESICLPHKVIVKMVERSDGIPLFARELTRMLVDAERKTSSTAVNQAKYEIPHTLKTLLASRLDRLGMAKETAQLASVIGRRFDYQLLAKLSFKDESILLADLDQLLSAGMIHIQHRTGDMPRYYFHHSLVCDSAYDSLTSHQKITIHNRIASLLETGYHDITVHQPEILAFHWSKAENFEQASVYGLKAASAALAKYLFQEAIDRAEETLSWKDRVSANETSVFRELELLKILQSAYIALKGYNSAEVKTTLSHSGKAFERLSTASSLTPSLLLGLYLHFILIPDYPKLDKLSEKLIGILDANQNDREKSLVHFLSGFGFFVQGKLNAALEQFDKTLACYDDARDADQILTFGHDSKTMALSLKAQSYTTMGLHDEADRSLQKALDWAKHLNNVQLEACSLAYRMGALHCREDKAALARELPYLAELVNQHQLIIWRNFTRFYDSWLKSDLAAATFTFHSWQRANVNIGSVYWNLLIAQIEVANGLWGDAVKRLDTYIEFAETWGESHYLPELYRVKGIALKVDKKDRDQIVHCFEKSITIARQMGANFFADKSIKELKLV